MTARGCLWHRRSPLKRSTGRLSRQPVEPELQKETDGRIDRSEVRDTPWDPLARKGRWFVWNSRRGNHLGQRSTKPHQQAGHMDASDPIRPSKTLAARGPSTYGSRLKAGTTKSLKLRYFNTVSVVPAKAGTHSHRRLLLRWIAAPAFVQCTSVIMALGRDDDVCLSSLRANGSRKCAPVDRFREVIHSQPNKDGLLRRCPS